VIECAATESVVVLIPATPDPFSIPVPSVVLPSLKVTVPVGVPDPGDTGLTVAVSVTDWPKTEGFTEEVTVVVVFAWFTVWVRVFDVLLAKAELPPYAAVI
jgi:hypothetical protein